MAEVATVMPVVRYAPRVPGDTCGSTIAPFAPASVTIAASAVVSFVVPSPFASLSCALVV